MAIAVRQVKTGVVTGEDSTVEIAPDSAVLAGSALVLIGAGVYADGSLPTPRLSSVSDTGSNTWANVTNARGAGSYSPNVYCAVAQNVGAGTPTVTGSFDSSSGNKISWALLEVTGVLTSGAVDEIVASITTVSSTSSSAGPTGTLDQANNLLILVAGGWFGVPTNPSGWTSVLSQQNGVNVGAQISHRVIATTDPQTGTVPHEATSGASALMVVLKEAAAGGALRYKFQLDPAAFTSGDTGITGYVWRNSGPDGTLAEKYEGLAGDATAGDLLITSVPVGVQIGDTITGVFFNSSDTSGIITGSVESV